MTWNPSARAQGRARRALGRAVRDLRRDQRLTQVELEERSGLDQTVISRLERGIDVKLRMTRLIDVLDSLGVADVVLESADDVDSMASVFRQLARKRDGG